MFQTQLRFRFGDVDLAGIAYYPKLLHACHCAMEDWWSDGLGKPYAAVMAEERYGMPAVHLDVDFVKPVRYGDVLTVQIGVLAIGSTSVELGFRLLGGDGDDDLRCTARIKTVGVDMDSLRPVPVPERWRGEFERHRVSPDFLRGTGDS